MNEHEEPTPGPTAPPDQPGHEGGGQPGRRAPDPVAPGEIGPGGPRRLLASRATGWAVAGVLACAVVGLSVALASTSSTPVARISIGATVPGRFGPVLPGRFNAGSAPFGGRLGYGERGAVGTVDHVSATRFTMTTPRRRETDRRRAILHRLPRGGELGVRQRGEARRHRPRVRLLARLDDPGGAGRRAARGWRALRSPRYGAGGVIGTSPPLGVPGAGRLPAIGASR